MGRRNEGRHHTVMARKDEKGVSIRKIKVRRRRGTWAMEGCKGLEGDVGAAGVGFGA